MGSKRKKGDNGGGGEEGKEMITDSRFSKAHTDPKWRRLPRRESKVTIDSRFKGVLNDKASAPVDKRGKRRRRGSAKDSLKEYYRIDEDEKKKKQKRNEEDESGDDESDGDEKLMALEAEARRRKSEQSIEEESDEESKSPLKLASSDEEESDENAADSEEEEDNEDVSEEEEDTDEDDEAMYEDDGPEVAEEEIASIEKETHRLAIVNMDWRYVTAKDLYVVFNSFLPKDGRLLSVAVYPSDFGLERMKEEEIHGPAIDGDKKNEDNSDVDDDDEVEDDEDKDVINERLRDYEKSRLRYYFAVAECDSSATADHLYKSCDGIEFERSSNKLDLRFIPDSMEFKHPPRDIATEAPATYQGLDFQSQALQMSRVNVSWDEDEPHRVRTLNRRFNPDQLADLELKEFLASDESESDDSDDDEEKRKEKYRALMESKDVDSDKDEDGENDQDMVVEFNTGLEDLSNKFREKKEEKPETVWEAQLRKMREKKRARRMQKKDDDDDDSSDDSSSDDDDDYNVDDHKKKKKKKKKMMNKNKKGLEKKLAADERSLAELELIVADENGGAGKGLKGYNIKGKGKKRSKEMAEEKIPSADPDDQRFSAAFTDPNYALDPTNPQFKRSATYVKQLTQKQKEDPRSQEEQVKDVETKKASTTDGTVESSKKRNFAESATVKSLKLKMQQKGSEKKKEGTTELAQRVKNKAKALSNK